MLPTGAPIVLVHGLFGNLADSKILSGFGDANVHAPDLMGYGAYHEMNVEGVTLYDQASHLAQQIRLLGDEKVHLVGHSVGGAVSAILCAQYPELVATFTSVEGNFTLADAFWSSMAASKSVSEVASMVETFRTVPDAWIAAAGVPTNSWTSVLARNWLYNQPASTIAAQAKAVVAATGQKSYLNGFRKIAARMPIFLIAGAKSATDWHVPDWANELCVMRLNIPGCGHLMMAEEPDLFAMSVLICLSTHRSVTGSPSR